MANINAEIFSVTNFLTSLKSVIFYPNTESVNSNNKIGEIIDIMPILKFTEKFLGSPMSCNKESEIFNKILDIRG